jgi:hypothetical protein
MIDLISTDDALEEGRFALDRLEKQLKLRAAVRTPDQQSETSSKLTSSVSRKKLDQLPRGARLNNREESLGLTVEVRIFPLKLTVFYLSKIRNWMIADY